MAFVGVPKTIDNDILLMDKSFGFDTAVEEAQRANYIEVQNDVNCYLLILLIFTIKCSSIIENLWAASISALTTYSFLLKSFVYNAFSSSNY